MLQAKPALNGLILDYRTTESYLHITTDIGYLKLQPYTDQIIQITYALEDHFSVEKTMGVLADPEKVQWKIEESSEALKLITKDLRLSIDKKTSAITYRDAHDGLLLQEATYDSKSLQAFASYKTILDADSVIEQIKTADGIKESIVNAKKVYDKELYHGRLKLNWQEGEALYGLGQHEEGVMNLRGHVQYVHQSNKKIAIPFLLSTKNYGLLLDTYAPMTFRDNEFGSYLYTEAIETLCYYFIQGDTFDDIIGGYRFLTGQASMLPRWAFGYMQSFERYEDAAELVATAKEYRHRQIPLDSLVLDWDSWEPGQWGQKSFDPKRFPDPQAMTDDLHDLHVHLMVSIWPNMHESSDNYKEAKEAGTLFQRSELYNAFHPKARSLYWQQAQKGLFDFGIDAWWTDSCEPFAPEWSLEKASEPAINMVAFHDLAKNYMAETHTNAYALAHASTIYEGQRSVTNDKRVINLTRSGYTGQQRFGNIFWSGDITAKWATLRSQIVAGLNFCASGLPYWTLDIGGFFVKRSVQWFWDGDYDDGNKDEGYRQLYTRWFQYATFLPILRAHGTDTRREVWQFGEEGSPYYDAMVKFIGLRYALLPYIYSMAGWVTQEDYTMLRLLAFDYKDDANVYNIADQFMFGPSFMVCPITEPVSSRSVYLPEGKDWYDYWQGQRYSGGQWITAQAPMDKIPLYLPAGAMIPMAQPMAHTEAFKGTDYDLMVYTGDHGHFTLYVDENDGYGYEKGKYAMIDMTWDDHEQTLHLSPITGDPSMVPDLVNFAIHLNGHKVKDLTYKGKALTCPCRPL